MAWKGIFAGKREPMKVAEKHYILKTRMSPPWPEKTDVITFGMGCFWCSENIFNQLDGVYSTQVGYAQGNTEHPTYNDVCHGRTGHNEVCRVVYWPEKIKLWTLLFYFWNRHNPTTLNQQRNDKGTQYRSGIYYSSGEQLPTIMKSKNLYQKILTAKGKGEIKTEIQPSDTFYYAEDHHQQYDAKPGARGYCGLLPIFGCHLPEEEPKEVEDEKKSEVEDEKKLEVEDEKKSELKLD